jgi:hypothetical protein
MVVLKAYNCFKVGRLGFLVRLVMVVSTIPLTPSKLTLIKSLIICLNIQLLFS